jgi:cell division protein FtsB
MKTREKILLSFAILALGSMLFFVIFGENGLADLNLLKQERNLLLGKNRELEQKNIALYREIHRLKNDLKYIESVARRELGMIGKDEVIFKLKNSGSKTNDK